MLKNGYWLNQFANISYFKVIFKFSALTFYISYIRHSTFLSTFLHTIVHIIHYTLLFILNCLLSILYCLIYTLYVTFSDMSCVFYGVNQS